MKKAAVVKFKLRIEFSENIPFDKVGELMENIVCGLTDKADYSGLAPEDTGYTKKIILSHQNIIISKVFY